MRTLSLLLLFNWSLALSSQTINTKQILISESKLSWTAKSSITGSYSGTINYQSGTITVKENELVSAEVVVDMQSLLAENKELESHIRGEDFFDVEKHPTATFILDQVTKIEQNNTAIKGKMTIIGTTKEIESNTMITKDQDRLRVSGRIVIDRTAFGVYHNSPNFFTRLKEKSIADEFTIEVDLIFQ